MSWANFFLGGNWDRREWPDFLDVRHDRAKDADDVRRYWPERHVSVRRQYDGGEYDNWYHYVCECGCEWEQWRTEPKFCPDCRGRIEIS